MSTPQIAQSTPDDPFAKVPGETSIPIDYAQHNFEFTRRWFRNRNQSTWSTFLLPRYGGGRRMNLLQIGVFEGMDLVWCCQHLLTHPSSQAVAVDPWDPMPPKWTSEGIQAVEARARHNLSPWADKVELVKGYSQEFLSLTPPRMRFDLIVIDGCHDAGPVFQDASLSLALTKPGSWLVFDDVRNKNRKRNHVKEGIRRFLEIFGERVKFQWSHRHCDCFEVL